MKKETKNKIIFFILTFLIFSGIFYILLRLDFFNFILPIYTYKGFALIFLTTILLTITQIIIKKKWIQYIDYKDITISILIFLLIHLLVFGMVAITIERSFSVFMLSEISKMEDQTITLEETENLFVEKYVKSHKAFEKRFNEQIVTGSLEEISEDKYKMTSKGNFIVKIFKILNNIYSVNSELL